jgi:hypothetical protein
MTNIIATLVLCVTTNVATTDNASGCKICFDAGPGSIPAVFYYNGSHVCAPYKPATERTETTEVIESGQVLFAWRGERMAVPFRRVLSRTVRRWTLKRTEQWEESKP